MVARAAGWRSAIALDRQMERAGMLAMAVTISLALDLLTAKATGYDLAAYVMAARRLVAGEPVYPGSGLVLGPFGQFLYPPPVALLFVPLAILPFNVGRLVSLLSMVALAVLVAWTLVRELRPQVRYWASAGIALFFPLIWEIQLGNLTLATVALCMFAWRASRQRRWPAATALAGALGLKLLALPLLPFFALARRTSVLVWSVAILVAVGLLTLPLVSGLWGPYLGTLAAIASAPPGGGSNVVPVLFAAPALRPVFPAVGLATVLACGLAARRDPAAADHAFKVALAATPFVASTLWYPYLVFALPLLVSDARASADPRWRGVFVAIRPFTWLLMQAQLVRDGDRDFILPLIGLLVLIAAGLLELASARRVMGAGATGMAPTADR